MRKLATLFLAVAAVISVGSVAHAQAPEFLLKFGSFGTGDGQFFNPTGVTVHPTSGNIIVVDKVTKQGHRI